MTKKVGSKKTNKLNYTKHIANIVGADASVRPQNQRGITLIALVITIIVMLILVAVTVTVAINGGLFGMAKKAKADTEEEQAKENTLSTGRVKIDGTWYDSMEDYVNGEPSENQKDENAGGGSAMPSYQDASKTGENGTLTENALWTEENGDTAVIPKGFKVVNGKDGEGDQSIANGLVVQDADENEFVWIPVKYTATGNKDNHGLDEGFLEAFYRSDWLNNERTTSSYFNYTEPYLDGYDGEEDDYYEMMKSVQDSGGFYIGRYEAGSTIARTDTSNGTTGVVVKRDQYPYIYVTWGNGMNDIDSDVIYNGKNQGKGAVYLSKHMYDNKNVGVVSTLCYGIQWDAMLDFVKDSSHDVTNSTNWGNHLDSTWKIDRKGVQYSTSKNEWKPAEELEKSVNQYYLLTTGASDYFTAKNIYDVAGNCLEWTMEKDIGEYRVYRSGLYGSGGSYPSASTRASYSPGQTVSGQCSFRLALYIKN